MQGSRFRPFLAVGISYFFIAVVLPLILIRSTGDEGKFTVSGTAWSLAAGAAGAVGAFGILLAFNVGGKPSYVMPLVFGLAPVVNAFWSIYVAGTWKNVSPWFLSGLILVAVGAVVVLWFKPPEKAHAAQPPAPTAVAENPIIDSE